MDGQPSGSGRVVRVHLACRANLPIGSYLRVTGANLWDPEGNSFYPNDPTDARRVSNVMEQMAFDAGFIGANVVNAANQQHLIDDSDTLIMSRNENGIQAGQVVEEALGTKSSFMTCYDSHTPMYASSVEMVTSPDTYPIWKTKRPVILVLTDNDIANHGLNKDGIGDADSRSISGVVQHRYRYLVVTPGAETGIPYESPEENCDQHLDDVNRALEKTVITNRNMDQFGTAGNGSLTSSDIEHVPGASSSWPVSLWENPFLPIHEGKEECNVIEREDSVDSSALRSSIQSEASFVGFRTAYTSRESVLANLPFRTLYIDTATASVMKPPEKNIMSLHEVVPDYTSDGILIDNWNNKNDIAFYPYLLHEELMSQKARDYETVSLASDVGEERSCEKRRIYIVCYHLPVIVSKHPETEEWHACWAESLLAKTETSSFHSLYEPHWVGTVTTTCPIANEADKDALQSLLAAMDCTVLFFDEAIRDAHYMGFCKQVLWLAFHHVDLCDMQDPAFSFDLNVAPTEVINNGSLFDIRSAWDQSQIKHWWEAFNFVNRSFAVEVSKMVGPKDIVWIHDYHLCLLPRMLGEEETRLIRNPTKKIFFLHIPFPVSMIFKELECGTNILEGILHADVVGFHGFIDARHFLSSSKRILGLTQESLAGGLIGVKYKGQTVVLTMRSVSIEPYIIDAAIDLKTTRSEEARLRSKHHGRMIISGVDAAQYLSGVALKLAAYEQLLTDYQGSREKIVLIQRCLIPGVRRLDEARTIGMIRLTVKRIKSLFGDHVIDYEEVFGSSLPLDQRLALWKVTDCLLNTEVREGLNLLPLEFVYTQKYSAIPGIVIASEFSAASAVLNGALRISPFNKKSILSAIDRALNMSREERIGRNLRDIEFVSSSSSNQWMTNVLKDLSEQESSFEDDDENESSKFTKISSEIISVAAFLSDEYQKRLARINPNSVISAYKTTSKRVIILDFNGTIVIKEAVDRYLKRDSIGSAGDTPPLKVIQSLEKLCADPQNTVFVVSGDNMENLEHAVGNISGLGLAASNGSCYSPPMQHGDTMRNWLALDLGVDWKSVEEVALPIMTKYTTRTNGSFIKSAHSSLGWSYYSCDPDFGSLQAKYLVIELERALADFDVRFVNLKGVVEVVPRRLNKGIIVKKILRYVAASDDNKGVDFVLCIGDDVSDEKMFTSVYSFASEMEDDQIDVFPTPSPLHLSGKVLPEGSPFLRDVSCVRCKSIGTTTFIFTVVVGKKKSHASHFVEDEVGVADLLVKIAEGTNLASFNRNKEGERNLMQFS